MDSAKKTLAVLSCVVFFVMLGIAMIIPALPQYALAFGADPFLIGLLVGALPAARLFLNLPAGALGDRLGNVAMMRYGLALIAISSAIATVAFSYTVLLAVRVVEGIGSAFYVTSSLATLAKAAPPDRRGRYMGVYVNMLLVGQVVGPAIGGAVTVQWGLRAPFAAYSIAAAGGLLVLILALDVVQGSTRARLDWTAVRKLLRDRSFLTVNLGPLAAFFMRGGLIATVIPLFIHFNWGLPAAGATATAGILLTVMALASLVTMYPSGVLADRYGRKGTFVTSLVLMGLVTPFIFWARDLPSAMIVMAVFGLVIGLHGPLAAWVTDLAPPESLGTAMGLYRTIGDVGYFIGPVVLGGVLEATRADGEVTAAPFLVASGWMIATGLLLLTARDPSGERARARTGALANPPPGVG